MKFIARIEVNKKRCIIVASTTNDASFFSCDLLRQMI